MFTIISNSMYRLIIRIHFNSYKHFLFFLACIFYYLFCPAFKTGSLIGKLFFNDQ